MANVTVIDVARRAGVSKSTVSLVINNSNKVHPATAEKVRQAIRELNYVPSRAARSLQSGRSHLLGVILSDITNLYFSELVRSITNIAGQRGYDVMVFDTDYNIGLLNLHLEHLRQYRCDGVFVLTTERSLPVVNRLRQAGLPAVLLNWGTTDERVANLAVDYHAAMAALVDHLVALGHKRLALISGPADYYSAVAKEEAFRWACARRAASLAEPLFIDGGVRLVEKTGEQIAGQVMCMGDALRPTALVAFNDLVAISTLRALQVRGVSVPGQISLAGIDDISIAAYITPSLTTLRQPRRQMGQMAFEMLQDLIDGKKGPGEQRSVSPRLIVRESTGPVR